MKKKGPLERGVALNFHCLWHIHKNMGIGGKEGKKTTKMYVLWIMGMLNYWPFLISYP
jgi:hypothetical protein